MELSKQQKEFQDYLKTCPEYLKQCKFFKGEIECPYLDSDRRSLYWNLERNVIYLHPRNNSYFKEFLKIFFERYRLNYDEL